MRWLTAGLVALATAVAVSVVANGADRLAADPPVVKLTGVTARAGTDLVAVLIEASEPAAYVTTRPDPLTVLVDLRHADAAGAVNRVVPGPGSVLQRVTIEEASASDGANLARVRLSLLRPVPHTVRADRNLIRVELAASDAPAAAAPPSAAQKPVSDGRRVIESISKANEAGALTITLKGIGPLMPATSQILKDLPPRLVLDFSETDTTAPATTAVNQGPVQRVRVARNSADPLVTRVVLDLARVAPYDVRPMPSGELLIRFPDTETAGGTPPVAAAAATPAPRSGSPAAAPAGPAPKPPAGTAAPTGTTSTPPAPKPAAAVPATANPYTAPAKAAPTPPPVPLAAPPATPPPATTARRQGPPTPPPALQSQAPGGTLQKQYTGHAVGFDFQGVDLRAVIRAFAEISGLNIVIDPAVKGTVDVSLKDVPWDQAFDIILRSNKLGWTVDGTIVRIAPLTVLADEEKERRKYSEEQALSGELRVVTRPLSYAKAEEVVDLVKSSALSNRGSAVVDKRTNMIIMSDLPVYLDKAATLLDTLDQPEMQVEIEAKIVRTTRTYAQQLGLEWGFGGKAVPELGNTTGVAFPNSVVGGVDVGRSVSQPSGQATLALGAINGAFSLDVSLSALERDGKLKILLTPRVVTQNNVPAIITRGQEIPYETITQAPGSGSLVTAMIPTVQFKTAALKLAVTPRITPAGTVLMDVDVDNGSPGEVQPNGNRAINTQRAQTRVIVKDGATTVIGGIYGTSELKVDGGVPMLKRIPLLGWLFRDQQTDVEDEELLIFITPRIVKVQ